MKVRHLGPPLVCKDRQGAAVVSSEGVRFLFCCRVPCAPLLGSPPLGPPWAVALGAPWVGLLARPLWGLAPFPPGLVLFGVHTRYMHCDRYDSKLLWTVGESLMSVDIVAQGRAPINGSGAP